MIFVLECSRASAPPGRWSRFRPPGCLRQQVTGELIYFFKLLPQNGHLPSFACTYCRRQRLQVFAPFGGCFALGVWQILVGMLILPPLLLHPNLKSTRLTNLYIAFVFPFARMPTDWAEILDKLFVRWKHRRTPQVHCHCASVTSSPACLSCNAGSASFCSAAYAGTPCARS